MRRSSSAEAKKMLGEFRGLQREAAERHPTRSAMAGRKEEHRAERQHGDAEQGPDDFRTSQLVIVHPQRRDHEHETDRRPRELADEDVGGGVVLVERLDGRGAVHHDQARPHEEQGRPNQQLV
jgi:hypothetical protein